jgi:hypothetical protein
MPGFYSPMSTLDTGRVTGATLGVELAEAEERGGAGGRSERPPLKDEGFRVLFSPLKEEGCAAGGVSGCG